MNGALLFEDKDKEMLRRMLWQAAEFSGVEVLTYCLLSNHFHVLVHVPAKGEIADAEVIRRYRRLYPKDTAFTRQHGGGVLDDPAMNVEAALAGGGPVADKLRGSLLRRMGDVSEFMKTVKQRFSVWYNRTHQRYGTLWAECFKSVLVESDRHALATVAAYIDLNPVRASLVEDPKDYRFCGYAEALGEGNVPKVVMPENSDEPNARRLSLTVAEPRAGLRYAPPGSGLGHRPSSASTPTGGGSVLYER